MASRAALHLLGCLGLDKILGDKDVIVIKGDSYSHLLKRGEAFSWVQA
jgi:hypothetical protein